jgi:hypothetical protein
MLIASCSAEWGVPAACGPIVGTVASGRMTLAKGMVRTPSDYSMQIVPEGFSPLDNRQSLGYQSYGWFIATFLVFQSFPLLREILHDQCPLKVSSSGGTANNGIIKPKKLGIHNQSLLGLGPKYKGWCQNHGTCSRSRVRISYPSHRAS